MIPEIRKCCVEVVDFVRDSEYKRIEEAASGVERIIRSHETNGSSVDSRLVVVTGIGFVVPNKVADHIRDLRQQIKQLQDHCSELTRDVNVARADHS